MTDAQRPEWVEVRSHRAIVSCPADEVVSTLLKINEQFPNRHLKLEMNYDFDSDRTLIKFYDMSQPEVKEGDPCTRIELT